MANRTILMYGDTGDGKTAQIGEMVEQKMRDEERMKALCAMRNSGIPAVYCRNLEVQP